MTAKPWSPWIKVGALAYPHYTPAKAGRIVAMRPGKKKYEKGDWPLKGTDLPGNYVCTVRMANGKEYEAADSELGDFEQLVEDHRRKYEKHEATANKLRSMT